MADPFVKWAYEPPRAEDVPAALARGIHMATLPPHGPVLLSLPMDDWTVEVDDADVAPSIGRDGDRPGGGGPARRCARWRSGWQAAKNPVMVTGQDVDSSGAWDAAVALAEKQRLRRVGHARAGRRAARVPGGPPALPRRAAARDRPGRARRSRATTS